MPLEEFQCQISEEFEQWRSRSNAINPMHCPTCNAIAKRLYSTRGLRMSPAIDGVSLTGGLDALALSRLRSHLG